MDLEKMIEAKRAEEIKIDFGKMEETIEAKRAEQNRQSIDAMNKQAADAITNKLEWNELFGKAMSEDKRNRESMEKEIAEIQAEADERIEQVKTRYRARYGEKSWNSTLDGSYRNFIRGLMNNR